MKKLIIIVAAVLSLAACTNTQKGATAGALVGGVAGAAVSGGSLVGTAIGATGGALVGAYLGQVSDQPGQCYYKNSRGQIYIDTCPR